MPRIGCVIADQECELHEVLIAGPDLRWASELTRRLTGISIHQTAELPAASEILTTTDLLIVDDPFAAETVDYLAKVRAASPDLPVIYCLDPAADARVVRRLVLELGVKEVVFHPLDAETLARQVAALLGIPYSPISETGAVAQNDLARRLAEAWGRAKSKMLARVETLDEAGEAWLQGRLDPQLRLEAQGEAHKLAGSLGTFGLAAGTRFARELERRLEGNARGTESQAHRFLEIVAALRLEVER